MNFPLSSSAPLDRATRYTRGSRSVYTVAHQKGELRIALVACLTNDGQHTWAASGAPVQMESMLREKFRGRRRHADRKGQFRID